MKHYGQSDFDWKKNKLYLTGKKTGYSVIEEKGHPGMFRIRWPDGILSEDFYNLTRAKDHASTIAAEDMRKTIGAEGLGQPTDALESKIGMDVAK